MTGLNEKIVGALMLMLSAYAYADGPGANAPETFTVANISPLPVEIVPPVPEPQRYLHRYEMTYQSNQNKSFTGPFDNFYSAAVTHDFHLGASQASPPPGPGPASPQQQASNYLQLGPYTGPQISIVQVPDSTLTLGAQPQRRLSLTVDDWVFSGTARVAVLHSHDTGATLTVRHGF